jgi:hypothetical protein
MQSLSKGTKWTGRYYSDNILSQIGALRDVGGYRKMIVHSDNASPHIAKCVTEYIDQNSLKRAPHPPYSPDLAPSECPLVGDVKHQLQRHEFAEGAELASAISEIWNQIPTDTLVDVSDDWMRRSQRCINISGEHVE